MADFRANYKELFKAAHIEKLVVLIDDLDRCLPKVTIETLEAVRMFLSMENTVFIIAADDEMIRYSVKEYFPRVIEKEGEENGDAIDYSRFSDKYLEKLIQVPFHIPRIGTTEAQLYVLMLFIESQIGESEELKALANVVIKKLSKPWALEQITTEEIKEKLGSYYDNVVDKIWIAKNIDQFLAEHTGGNPRNIKRFVNMLLLRTEVARNRGFDENDLEIAILAKLMLVEQYEYDFYKAIAEELREDGSCPAFDAIVEQEEPGKTKEEGQSEARLIVDSEKKKKDKVAKQSEAEATKAEVPEYRNEKFGQRLAEETIKKWLESEPSLAGKDLRPYFFACTEKEDFFFSTQEERLRELIYAVRSGKFTTGSKGEEIKKLDNTDALYIFKKISDEIFRKIKLTQRIPKIVEGLRIFVKYRPELQSALTDFLLTLPIDKIGVWAISGWEECIPKTSASKSKLDEFVRKVQEQTKDQFVKSAATNALR